MKKFLMGFRFAIEGIIYALKTQVNLRFHLLASLLVILAGLVFHIQQREWLWILLSVALVWTTELMNTAIEALTDLVTKEHHELAKVAKDCAAGAVLIVSFFAAGIGFFVFYKYIIVMIRLLFLDYLGIQL